MPVFTFSGKDQSGKKISGERTAVNKQTVASQLRRERITPNSIREKGNLARVLRGEGTQTLVQKEAR